jgi:hypothetical protein
MRKLSCLIFVGIGLAAFAARAQTPPDHYDLKEMNFDMWCQEERQLPPERCDKRLPQDDADFEAYRAKIEKYEVPYLQKQRQEQEWDQTILHNDPVDEPSKPSQPTTQEPPTTPPS